MKMPYQTPAGKWAGAGRCKRSPVVVKASSSYGGRPLFESVGSHFFPVVPENSGKMRKILEEFENLAKCCAIHRNFWGNQTKSDKIRQNLMKI